jgi:hypothetical protein
MSNLTLPNKIELYVGRKIDFNKEVILQDDGQGAYIREWNVSDKTKPSDTDLSAFEQAALAQIELNKVLAKRASEYPSFADQFDTIFHDGLDAWKAQIQAVKDKYPKGVA